MHFLIAIYLIFIATIHLFIKILTFTNFIANISDSPSTGKIYDRTVNKSAFTSQSVNTLSNDHNWSVILGQ